MKGLLLGLMLLAGQAQAESIILPFQSFSDEFAVQALQQILDDKFSVRGGTLDAVVSITTITINNLRVYSGGEDIVISTAAGPSGEPGSIFMQGSSGRVGIGSNAPTKKLDVSGDGAFASNLEVLGNVGIGTTAGVPDLHVYTSTSSIIRLTSGAGIWNLTTAENTTTLQKTGRVTTFRAQHNTSANLDQFIVGGTQGDSDSVLNVLGPTMMGTGLTDASQIEGGSTQLDLKYNFWDLASTPQQYDTSNAYGRLSLNDSLGTSSTHYAMLQWSPCTSGAACRLGVFTINHETRVGIGARLTGLDLKPIESRLHVIAPTDTAKGSSYSLFLVSSSETAASGQDEDWFEVKNDGNVCISGDCKTAWPSEDFFPSTGAAVTAPLTGAGTASSPLDISATAFFPSTGAAATAPLSGAGTASSPLEISGTAFFPSSGAVVNLPGYGDGTASNPINFTAISLTTAVIGVLPEANGGTNATTLLAAGTGKFVRLTGDTMTGHLGVNGATVTVRDSSSGVTVMRAVAGDSADNTILYPLLVGRESSALIPNTDSTFGVGIDLSAKGFGTTLGTYGQLKAVRTGTDGGFGVGHTKLILSASDDHVVTDVVHIYGDGRVGISTGIPQYALDVSSFAKAGAFCDNTNICISTWTALSQYFVRLTGDTMTGTLNISSSFTATGQGVVGGTFTVQGTDFSVGGSTFVVNAGSVGIGTSAPGASKFNVVTEGLAAATGNHAVFTAYHNSAVGGQFPRFVFQGSSGTMASPTLLPASNSAGRFDFKAYDGNEFRNIGFWAVNTETGMADDAAFGNFQIGVSTGGTTYVETVRVTAGQNIGFNTNTFGTGAKKVIGIGEGTPPTSSPADMVQLFSTSPAAGQAELYVLDEQGNTTLLSPHNFDLFQPNTTDPALPWSYLSRNFYAGKEINVDMLKLARLVEQLTGEQIVYTRDLPDSQVRDWAADEEGKRVKRDEEIAAWDAAEEKTGERPKPYVKKAAPAWLAPRLKRK